MEDRKLLRRHLVYYLRVFDSDTDELIGSVVDITTDGLKLISDHEFDLDRFYNARITIPEETRVSKEIKFKIRSIWSAKDINPDFFVAGFHAEELADDIKTKILCLINEFGFKE